MSQAVEILDIKKVTHDVKQFTTIKPKAYDFEPGQATDVAINKQGWNEQKRPFTFASLPSDDKLEFVIKIYTDHEGVTRELDSLSTGDSLLIGEPYGTITYQGEGVFIAGGAGVTPFIAIFRSLGKRGKIGANKLIFSNKTADDIILEEEFRQLLGDKHFINTLTREKRKSYDYGRITKEKLEAYIQNFDQHFYICGPMPFVLDISNALNELGANMDAIVLEE